MSESSNDVPVIEVEDHDEMVSISPVTLEEIEEVVEIKKKESDDMSEVSLATMERPRRCWGIFSCIKCPSFSWKSKTARAVEAMAEDSIDIVKTVIEIGAMIDVLKSSIDEMNEQIDLVRSRL